MNCSLCKHWHQVSDIQGECRRNPPTPFFVPQPETSWALVQNNSTNGFEGKWPTTKDYEYCGEFKIKK